MGYKLGGNIMAVIILLIAVLVGFCIISSEDLTNKTKMTFPSILILCGILVILVLTLFAFKENIRNEAIWDYQQGKYYIETQVYSDTTYVIKKCK